MADTNLNAAALILTGFVTGTVLGTTIVLEFGDYMPTGFPFSPSERLQWETLLAGFAALVGGYLAYRSTMLPLKHRQRQKSNKLAMQTLSKHYDAFGFYISLIRNNPNPEEVEFALKKTKEHTIKNIQNLLGHMQKLDLDTDIYSDKAEMNREVVTYALSDVLRAKETERFLRKIRVAEQASRRFINLFAPEEFELVETDTSDRTSNS
ncbi:hypothetical protein [Thalassospira sp.]|uniref:hypothetical protein n=1 Tax=Thalassospira sp. TaxID=1912094 RepID=UPI0025E2038F|nr:hypothetical protein [Thalassospira sp.]